MLYEITDGHGVRIGVHECIAPDLMAYLASLPVQGAPYTAEAQNTEAIPLSHRVRIQFAAHRFYVGMACGGGVVEGLNLLLRWLT